jgi:putative DNA primase/helicase
LDLTQDIPELREQARKERIKVVLLDPLVALLSGMDSHNDQQVRRALAPLAQWADQGDLAVNGLIHFNKGESNDALERVSGSGAFGNMARSVIMLGHREEDEDEEVVHLIHAKNNLGKKGPAWRCRLVETPVRRGGKVYESLRIVFEGPSEVHANDLVARASSGEERGQREEAAEFLAVTLAEGPVLTTEVLGMAKQIGISEMTLKRAKQSVGVEAFKSGTAWAWRLKTIKPGEEK